MEGTQPVPVWTANRGLAMMVRVALVAARREPLLLSSLDELRAGVERTRPSLIVAGEADARAAGLDAGALARLAGEGCLVVVAGRGDSLGTHPRVRFLTVPFTSRDFQALVPAEPARASAQAHPLPAPQPAPGFTTDPRVSSAGLEAIVLAAVREEVARKVDDIARKTVEDAVLRLVPELAEAIIRSELAKLLKDVEAGAVTDPEEEA